MAASFKTRASQSSRCMATANMKLFINALFSTALIIFSNVNLAQAAELKIGLAADISSLDPHYLNIAPNIALSSHIFDALVHVDAAGHLIPGLALSWKAIDATTWEFKLRPGVKFHDGSPFTAEDAIFSLERPATLTGSPGPFTSYTRQIISRQAIDPLTLRLKTATPYGALPLDVSTIFIVSKKVAQKATTDDFNTGRAMIGTGPFKFVGFKRGDRVELARNPNYWGIPSSWDKVTMRIISGSAPRMAALLAGDVDAIESVPTTDTVSLKRNPAFHVAQTVSWRTIFWTVDQIDHVSTFVSDINGKPLVSNPLRDRRVRRAISMAINRPAMIGYTMEGQAQAASNIVSPGILGYNDALKVEPFDVQGAKRLLTAAGYPNGFNLTLHGPNNRYVNDEQVVQTTAQFLSRIGIRAKVITLPLSVYFGQAKAGKFSVALLGWGTLAGDFGLRALLGTTNPQKGWGAWNWGKYSNPTMDQLVVQSLGSVDTEKRANFAKQAAAVAMNDYAVIPLHHQMATWAMRKGLNYTPRIDEFTFAQQFKAE
jgi:peptide/nickel transport system substrate-binding protein